MKQYIQNMTNKSDVGNIGENIACEHLKNNGYKIIARNFRKPWGELDIISRAKDKTLVIVEVKTLKSLYTNAVVAKDAAIHHEPLRTIHGEPRRTIAGLKPEDNLTAAKLNKLKKTAMLYMGANPELVQEDRGWRIDLIALDILTDLNNNVIDHSLRHYENIVI